MSGILALIAAIGSGGAVVSPLPGGTYTRTAIMPSSANVSLRFQTDGEVWSTSLGGTIVFRHRWYSPTTTSIGNSYWVRATVASGSTPTGSSTGTWLALTSDRTWTVSKSGSTAGTTTTTLTLAIASDSGGSNIIASGSYTLEASTEP